ncbi:hypothetical protein [Cytobacillus gottheilii]|uniref:Integron-associated effector binding protein domain-containing protein n=1 Tax=Cytobacillus gottheilii TaxID=859144 RepID=A0ABX8FE33_9BACI|nr:hypothetical protein [Cytobacillus gottheilii]QVY62112.1 hypothetical protein J1899_03095 [Cytobacillus gottheilii]
MRKIYLDRTAFSEAIGVNVEDTEIISAGTTIYSMGVHGRNEEYQRYANDYDIQFIFDDDIPHLELFTVPHVDIMAKDSKGGFIGTVYQKCDSESQAPICYINWDLECFIISENAEDFLSNIGTWEDNMKPYDKITVYRSKAEAEVELEFIDLSDILPLL